MKKTIATLALILTATSASAMDSWVTTNPKATLMSPNPTPSAAISTSGRSIFVDYIKEKGKRPADKGDIWSYRVSIFPKDSYICTNQSNQISVYYKIDDQKVGKLKGWVPASKDFFQLTAANLYANEEDLAEQPHYTTYYDSLYKKDKVTFHMNAFIEALKNGKELTIQTYDSCGESITFTVPLNGANTAISKLVK